MTINNSRKIFFIVEFVISLKYGKELRSTSLNGI